MRILTLALASAAVIVVPTAVQAQSNPLSSIFGCDNGNNRQRSGAVVGGLLGGLAGNQVAGEGDRTLETVLGAALGAAAGSYVGCQMSGADGDQAQTATLNALNQNRSTTWSNRQTGSSGRIDIVNSYEPSGAYSGDRGGRDDRDYRGRDDQWGRDEQRGRDYGANRLDDMRFAQGVQRPNTFDAMSERYTARSRVNIRSQPNTRASVVGQLRSGETFDSVARVAGGQWLLATRDGMAVGYVSQGAVRYVGANDMGRSDTARYDNRQQYQQSAAVCRTFDQTFLRSSNSRPTTERFTACRNERNEWVLEG